MVRTSVHNGEKDNIKWDAAQIKILAYSKAVPENPFRDAYAKVMYKKKSNTGLLPDHNQWGKKNPNNKGYQHYWVLWKKAVMPEHNYKLHKSENCFGKSSYQEAIKEGLGGSLGNRATSVKHDHKSENKWKRYLKHLKKQNNMIFRMSKRSDSCRELN